jgi:steroid delta-isomerase-like uncharacterized protein
MSTEENKRLVERFYAHHRTGTIGQATDVVTPDCIRHDPSGREEPGPSGFAARVARTEAAFSEWVSTPNIVMADGDKVAVRWTITAKHTGPCDGFPATGRNVKFSGVNIFRIENGRIAEIWNHRDDLSVLQQIGAVTQRIF